MSRDLNGVYTLPAGNPVAPNTTIETAWANPTMNDIAQALSDSLSRSGLGGMLAPFYNVSGTQAAPGISWANEQTSGWYRKAVNEFWYSVSGADVFGITTAGIVLAPGKNFTGLTELVSAINFLNNVAIQGTLQVVGIATIPLLSFPPSGTITANNVQAAIQQLDTLKAALSSPTFTGIPAAPTAAVNTNTTQLATTAFVNAEIANDAPTKTGTGASGTWNISILGNAATATNAAVATYAKQAPVDVTTGALTAAEAGKVRNATAGFTINNSIMLAGDIVSVYNDSATPITLTQGSGVTLRIPSEATGANRIIDAYSMATLWFKTSAIAVVTGAGVT